MALITNLFARRNRKLPPSREARAWTNGELRKFASLYRGDVINVSAWKDEDKEGGHYCDYFVNASSYTTSNFDGWRGSDNADRCLQIDLQKPLGPAYEGKFQVVFNHTTLEHVYQVFHAFSVLCRLSSDTVILVVPFQQHLHGPEDGDFWRFTPCCVRRLFADNELQVLYESAHASVGGTYLFYVACLDPARWEGQVPSSRIDETVLRKLHKRLRWKG